MWLGSLKEKKKILITRIPRLNFITRWTLKAVLFAFGGLIRVEHAERLAACPWPVIFALNHDNYAETVLVPAVLVYLCGGKITSFLVHWMFRVLPVISSLLKQINPIWIYNRRVRFAWMRRRKPHRQGDIFTQALQRSRKNLSIGIFPEGTRNKNPRVLKRGRLGVGRLALETGLPVIPLGIDSPGRSGRGKIRALGRMIIRVGRPLYFTDELRAAAKLQGETPGSQRGTAGMKEEAGFGREVSGTGGEKTLPAAQMHAGMFRLYARITRKVMVEISKLCGKQYPYNNQ